MIYFGFERASFLKRTPTLLIIAIGLGTDKMHTGSEHVALTHSGPTAGRNAFDWLSGIAWDYLQNLQLVGEFPGPLN